ncbi:MAG: DUF4240 domain-containing protein [Chloroflexota bacterium]|nr:DUF4240 domain-containing protein [Chloroflexota bacterium]
MMTEDEFWALIDEAREASGDKDHPMVDFLVDRLVAIGVKAVQDFDYWYHGFEARAYRFNLWDTCYLLNCSCSDDGFSDFRAWLISRGRDVYLRALDDPEILIDHLTTEDQAYGSLWVVSIEACKKLGVKFPDIIDRPTVIREVEGKSILEGFKESEYDAVLKEHFPVLFAKFGDCEKRDDFWFSQMKNSRNRQS